MLQGKKPLFFLIFTGLLNFLCAEPDFIYGPVTDYIVWTFTEGPVSFCEYAGLLPPGKNFSSLYENSADDALWVETVFEGDGLFTIETPSEYEAALSLYNENPEHFSLPETEEIETERKILTELNKLSLYAYGSENLSVQEKEGERVIVRSDSKNAVRSYYDDKMRITKKEIWNVSSLENGKRLSVQNFSYGEGAKPVSSVIVGGNEKKELFYDLKGRIVKSKNYNFYKDEKDEKYYNSGVTEWKYSDDGRLLEKYSEEYEMNGKKTKVLSVSSKKEVYEYKISDGNPDYFFYENGILRLTTVYSSTDSYITTMKFDDDFVVESYFAGGKRIKDLFYSKGVLRRTKKYGQ